MGSGRVRGRKSTLAAFGRRVIEACRLLAISIETSRSNYLLFSREVQEELSRLPIAAPTQPPPGDTASPPTDGVPRSDLVSALATAGRNVTQAANLLGGGRFTVHRLMKRYGLTSD